MKKGIAIIGIFCVMFALTACKSAEEVSPFSTPTAVVTEKPKPTPKPYSEYNQKLESAEVAVGHGMYVEDFGVSSVAELETQSDAIVLVTIKEKRTMDNEKHLAMGIHSGSTVAEMEIQEVFFTSDDLQVGDIIEMQEYCYLYDGSLSTSGRYYPTKEYETYLLFLETQEDGRAKYTPVDLWYGKYPVNPTAVAAQSGTISCETMELAGGEDTAPGDYIRLFGEVCEKYYTDEAVQTVLEREELLAEQ